MNTCFPAARQSRAISPCTANGADTATASTSGSAAISRWSAYRCAIPNLRRTSSPSFGRTSASPTSSHPGSDAKFGRCTRCAMYPAPTDPSRTGRVASPFTPQS
jgi:hypothetical protein